MINEFSGKILYQAIVTITATGAAQNLFADTDVVPPRVYVAGVHVAACAADDPVAANQKAGGNAGPCVVGGNGANKQLLRVDKDDTYGRNLPIWRGGPASGLPQIVGTINDKWKVTVFG